MKKILISLLLAGIYVLTPIISLGAEPQAALRTDMMNMLLDMKIPVAEDVNTKEVEPIEEMDSLPDANTIAAAAATVAENTDIGWLYEDGIWFYRNSEGNLLHGWHKIDGKWYYFDTTYAYMYANGWHYVEASGKRYYFASSGEAYTGWKYDSQYGDWYYFYEGLYRHGWVEVDEKWYYINNGRMIANEYAYEINGYYYGFQSNGVMRTNWHQANYTNASGTVDTDWYYYRSGGSAVDGWFEYNGEWYYLYDGWAADDGVREIGADKTVYAFNEDATMKSSEWYYDWWNKEWYYLDANGAGHDGWLQEGSIWYYCDNGLMYRNGWFQIGENEYAQFDSSGAWLGTSSTMPQS